MEYEEMRRMEETHCCAQCGMPLITKFDNDLEDYYLSCGTDPHHQGYKKLLLPSEALARGGIDKHLGKGAQTDLEKMAAEGVGALSKLPEKDVATSQPIPRDKMLALILWGQKLALNPYLGHVCLYFGKPYVTIDGYYYLLGKRDRTIDIGTRPLIREERKRYDIGEGDHAWLAEAWEKGERLPTTGLGIVTKEEIEGKSSRRPEEFRAPVVHAHPQRMAEKRAEWQLLRKLIPLEEVQGED